MNGSRGIVEQVKKFAILSLLLGAVGGAWADTSGRASTRFIPEQVRLIQKFQLPRGFGTMSQAVLCGNAEVCAIEVGQNIHFYSTRTGKEISVARTGTGIHDGAFSYDGKRFAAANDDGKVRVWNTKTGGMIYELDAGGGFS